MPVPLRAWATRLALMPAALLLASCASRIERFRVWLSQLTPAAAWRIAHENAAELLGVK